MNFEYPKKVRFKCSLCSICCGDTQTKTRRILLTEHEAKTIATKTKQHTSTFANKVADKSPYQYEMKKTEDQNKCVFLKKNRCTIYSMRPLICRFYPFGLKTDENQNKTFYFTDECPGIYIGKILTKTDFEIMLKNAAKRLNMDNKESLS